MERTLRERVEHEDLVAFLGAAFSGTGQDEHAEGDCAQRLSLGFLHEYVCVNYRRTYALCLALGINHFNRAEIVARLLHSGAPADPERRREEGLLIGAALRQLPPQRVYRLVRRLAAARVANRRTRAVLAEWLGGRDLAFDAVKYRRGLRALVRTAHLGVGEEAAAFLRSGACARPRWETPLFESVRRAHYEERALYELPHTVAEGLAAKLGVPRERYLERIAGNLTARERARLDASVRRRGAKVDELDLSRVPPTRLAIQLLSMRREERAARRDELEDALRASAARAWRATSSGDGLGRVACVLDRSRSSLGSDAKRNRPLAVALAVGAMARAGADAYRAFWTAPTDDELFVTPRGQTDLATPLLDALAWEPGLLIVVSDGFENDPPGAAAEVVRLWRERVRPARMPFVVHLSPVYEAARYAPRCLGPDVPTLGIRDAEDLATLLVLARLAGGEARLADLERHALERARHLFEPRAAEALP